VILTVDCLNCIKRTWYPCNLKIKTRITQDSFVPSVVMVERKFLFYFKEEKIIYKAASITTQLNIFLQSIKNFTNVNTVVLTYLFKSIYDLLYIDLFMMAKKLKLFYVLSSFLKIKKQNYHSITMTNRIILSHANQF